MTLIVISRTQLADRPINFHLDRPTAQTRHQICACDSSKFSVFHPLLAFDILTLKMYDIDRHFQGRRSKKVHFGPKRPQNRKIWTILSSCIKKNIRRQILIKRNFHVRGQIFKFSILKVSPILMCDTSFCSPWRALNDNRILTLKMHDRDSNFKDKVGGQAMKFSFRPTYSPNRTSYLCAWYLKIFSASPYTRFWYLDLKNVRRLPYFWRSKVENGTFSIKTPP
jgi:hypothetical protein